MSVILSEAKSLAVNELGGRVALRDQGGVLAGGAWPVLDY
jgi:hypothetical protein